MSTPSPLQIKTDYLNVLLDIASQRTQQRGSCVYELRLGVSLRDLRLLRAIGTHPNITVGELVTHCGIEKTLTSKRVSALVKKHLIGRRFSKRDARRVKLHLTEAGCDLVLQAEPLGKQLEAGFSDYLSANEIKQLRHILHKLIAAETDTRHLFDTYIKQLKERNDSDTHDFPIK